MKIFRRLVAMFLAASIVAGCLPGLINFREFAFNQNVLAYEGEDFIFDDFDEDINLVSLNDIRDYQVKAVGLDNYESFIVRLYQVTLEREADESGLSYWSSLLRDKQITGIAAAYNFVMSDEFQAKPYTEDEYISLMYNAFFGRDAADSEIAYWADLMRSGVDRNVIFENFGNSDEFYATCNEYGIIAGTYRSDVDVWRTSKINLFVDGLYSVILGRHSDKGGMTYWTNALINGEQTGAVAAYGFVFSDEYYSKNKDDDSFIKDLYLAFMGREADDSGLNYWKSCITSGMTDLSVFNSFVLSNEFRGICDGYGIISGEMVQSSRAYARPGSEPPPSPTPTPIGTLTGICEDDCRVDIMDTDGDAVYDTLRFYGEGSITQTSQNVDYNSYSSTIRNIIIEEGVTSLSRYAIYDFPLITEITIPSTVTDVGYESFHNSPLLETIRIEGVLSGMAGISFCNSKNATVITSCMNSNTIRYSFTDSSKISIIHNGDNLLCKVCMNASVIEMCGGGTYFMITDDDGDGIYDDGHIRGAGNINLYYDGSSGPFINHNGEYDCIIFDCDVVKIPANVFRNCTCITSVTFPESLQTIGASAFRNTGLTSVVIHGNVTNVGTSAFADCADLSSVTIENSDNPLKFSTDCFTNCVSLVSVCFPQRVSQSFLDEFCGCTSLRSLTFEGNCIVYGNLCEMSVWKGLTSVTADCATIEKYIKNFAVNATFTYIHNSNSDACWTCNPPYIEGVDASEYSYEIIPFYLNFNRYVFVKTENPDPTSFCLYDPDTIYAVNRSDNYYRPTDKRFIDVNYSNYETGYFNGGYICFCPYSDGGNLVLYQNMRVAPYAEEEYAYIETETVINAPRLTNIYDLLYELCVDESKSGWENINSVQSFLNDKSIYPIAISDPSKPSSLPYACLMGPEYADQRISLRFYGYRYLDSTFLAYQAYPFILDSAAFPTVMANMAVRLMPDAKVGRVPDYHYMVYVTYNGETKYFGGDGSRGTYDNRAQSELYMLLESHITEVFYSPDQFTPDEWYNVLFGYWDKAVAEMSEQYNLMRESYISTHVTSQDAWFRLVDGKYTFYSTKFGYNYRNVWVDGRLLGQWYVWDKGATFAEHSTADILVPNVTYVNFQGETLTADAWYVYDATYDCWVAYRNYGEFSPSSYLNFSYSQILANSPTLVLTRQQVMAMGIDRNTNTEPAHGYVYDGTVMPGTPY